MAPQCAARFTLRLDLPGKKKPFITFQCEKEAHMGEEHFTTNVDPEGRPWKVSWTEKKTGGE